MGDADRYNPRFDFEHFAKTARGYVANILNADECRLFYKIATRQTFGFIFVSVGSRNGTRD